MCSNGVIGATGVKCLLLADDTSDPKNKLLLVAMAQAWLKLAQRAEENLTPDFVYETPSPLGKAATP